MPSSVEFWSDLFEQGQAQERVMRVPGRVLFKKGRPFLLLPRHRGAAVETLNLYPAQTRAARSTRSALKSLLRIGLPFGTRRATLAFGRDDPYVQFLAGLAGAPLAETPGLGMLAGNPRSPGQRLVVLVFDSAGHPVAVAKTGVTTEARSLIQREQGFLRAVQNTTGGIPQLRAAFEGPRVSALALDFVRGDSPRPESAEALPALLGAWVNSQKTVALAETQDWRRLATAASANPIFRQINRKLGDRRVQVTLCHGDFAPWNIKVSSNGQWVVLDWERGELAGVPGWDWLHYIIQPAILVRHLRLPALLSLAERSLSSKSFLDYASQAGISGIERDALRAYLLHCVEVIKPAEGLAETRALLEALV